jgi:nicotinate phosphoribosyltransferase
MREDVLALAEERVDGEPLLVPVMRGGRRLPGLPSLADGRARAATELARLPEALRRLEDAAAYPVIVTPALRALARALDAE